MNDRKREFESQIERYIANFAAKAGISYGANVAAGVGVSCEIEPTPDGFLSKDHFVRAYVAYKMKTVDSEIQDKYSRKIGGGLGTIGAICGERLLLYGIW